MKMVTLLAFPLMLFTTQVTSAGAQDAPAFPPANDGHSISIPATSMKFEDRGYRGLKNAKITVIDMFGNGRTGEHGTFMTFAPGLVSHVHTHTYDYYAVVIKGVMANYNPGGPQTKMGPGSYWYQKGHEPHTTACLSKEECLAFVVQSQKFDVQDLDKATQ